MYKKDVLHCKKTTWEPPGVLYQPEVVLFIYPAYPKTGTTLYYYMDFLMVKVHNGIFHSKIQVKQIKKRKKDVLNG